MNVVRAKSAGFCFGVGLALRTLDRQVALKEEFATGRLLTLGPIIHNPLVMDAYAQKGVACVEDIGEVRPEDHVVIRAHGIPMELEARLAATGATLVDATCPKVKKAQLAIAEEAATGKRLLLFGEKDHPEVRGLVSYAGNIGHVFSSMEELSLLPLDEKQQYFLAAQTTQDREGFAEAGNELAKRLGYAPVTLNTICDATKRRQEEAIAVARTVDAMVVVGGLNSGNTRRLAAVARSQGIPALHVERVEDLGEEDLENIATVGLTAGASTPDEHIDAMESFLRSRH